MSNPLTPHQSQYFAWLLTRQAASDTVESLASTLLDSQVDLNPHQVDAALFACRNPLSRGMILADEVGLGKTIEAGLVISQRWAERRRKILIIVPANLRKQWHQELQEKFGLNGLILETKNYQQGMSERRSPFLTEIGPAICSYQFAKSKANDIKEISWDLVVFDEAHRLRNVYKPDNVIARTLKNAVAHVSFKMLLTATPLQNSMQELYGLVSILDDHVFGSIDSFRLQIGANQRTGAEDSARSDYEKVIQSIVAAMHGRKFTNQDVSRFKEEKLPQLLSVIESGFRPCAEEIHHRSNGRKVKLKLYQLYQAYARVTGGDWLCPVVDDQKEDDAGASLNELNDSDIYTFDNAQAKRNIYKYIKADAVRREYEDEKLKAFGPFRFRLENICKRTLRRQVQAYVSYTSRRTIVQDFTPSDAEQQLYILVTDYLRRPNLNALPQRSRRLVSLVLWKLLASSTYAIAGALETMAKRLQDKLVKGDDIDLVKEFDRDYETLVETEDEFKLSDENNSVAAEQELYESRQSIEQEIDELRRFATLACGIRDNAKGLALIPALHKAFLELEQLGAPRKGIIFTESRRTQDYLLELLADTPYGNDIVLFNGSNSDSRAQTIYKNWLIQNECTGRVTGSKTADTRAALVDYFKERGTIMIATEAAAEGINLQFCSFVINYDLPWNPQRIEQRIGRCHRYGQKFDVVVVNLVNRSNEADARVYELLEKKFRLFDGVFGSSDEVLGAIGSGVDFERRIADIYRLCRSRSEIEASFAQLQTDLSSEIGEAMAEARRLLLENFDEDVQEKMRVRDEESRSARDRHERVLLDVTRAELGKFFSFDEGGFVLQKLPEGITLNEFGNIELGRYELPGRSGAGHIYRIQHPLAQWCMRQAKERTLGAAKILFNYDNYGVKISSLERFRGNGGWLMVQLVDVLALGHLEQHLVVAAVTHDGLVLSEDDPVKLLRLPAVSENSVAESSLTDELLTDLEGRKEVLIQDAKKRNFEHFEREVQKLDLWADDLSLVLERKLIKINQEIKDLRKSIERKLFSRAADDAMWSMRLYNESDAANQIEKEVISIRKRQMILEAQRNKLQCEFFTQRNEVEVKRNEMVTHLESQLLHKIVERTLFSIEWELK